MSKICNEILLNNKMVLSTGESLFNRCFVRKEVSWQLMLSLLGWTAVQQMYCFNSFSITHLQDPIKSVLEP